jgi:asparagine synthetase B (glutamine-hydrolysing)
MDPIDGGADPEHRKSSRKISIKGLPIYSGAVLTPHSPLFTALPAKTDFIELAKKLRGQFSIVIEDDSETIAISDFGCSRPVFYTPDREGKFRVSSHLRDLLPFSGNRLSLEALFFYVSRSGLGIDPLYADIREVRPATVTRFRDGRVDSAVYLDWNEYLETVPIGPKAAEERFFGIASEYLGAIAKARGPIACLLSGGIDSALIGWLLRSIGQHSPNLTADYTWKRYSEFSSASANARALGISIERVLVSSASRRRAFRALNSEKQNSPCCHAQSPVLFDLAHRAQLDGVATLATGDHADALFLGFDRFFAGFPRDSAGYLRTTAVLDAQAKLDQVYPKPSRGPQQDFLLSVFGSSSASCLAWEESINANDRSLMSQWADHTPLHTLQQLSGQIWAGISWQNTFLSVSQAFDERVEFISPFFDLEMIRFALSLPLEYKLQNGVTKVFLRNIASRLLGRSIPKRASPNPTRVWRLLPKFAERRALPSALRPEYDRLVRKNFFQKGRLWSEVDKLAAFGMWLGEQPLRDALPSK